jgi:hypothetical protein
MSHQDYIAGLSIDQLTRLIEMSQDKINATTSQKKVKCFVVSDNWVNYGHYRGSDPEAALSMFNRCFLEQTSKGSFESLSIKFEKYYPDEMKEIFSV